jgi:hypothetical protein
VKVFVKNYYRLHSLEEGTQLPNARYKLTNENGNAVLPTR